MSPFCRFLKDILQKKFHSSKPELEKTSPSKRSIMLPFCHISQEDVEEKYRSNNDFRRNRGLNEGYDVRKLDDDLRGQWNDFIKKHNNIIPDYFFSHVFDLVDEYILLGLGHCEQFYRADALLMYSQLYVLNSDPLFIKDPRFISIIEKLFQLQYSGPFGCYTEWDGEKSVFHEGFNLSHLAVFQRLIDNTPLWKGCYDARRVFFGYHVAAVVEYLYLVDPDATLPLRLALLERNCLYGNHAEILYHMVYTFKSESDKAALKKYAEESGNLELIDVTNTILSGGYNNTLWAI